MKSDPSQSLQRVLSRRDLIIYGLVILTPTAPYPVIGVVQQASGGHATLSYLVAMVAMLFTAASYARMSLEFPAAGSTYTYVQRGLNEHVGFLAGWAMLLDYLLIPLLSVVYASLTAARLLPDVPYMAWAMLFTLAITLANARGIRTTVRANTILMVIMSVSAILFAALAVIAATAQGGLASLWSPPAIYNPETFSLRAVMLGAGISALSYIGFDAVTTLAEDSKNPQRDVGFATVAVCVAQTAICAITVYLATLVWPDYRAFPAAETAILDIGGRIGGPWMMGWITFVLLVAALASAMTGQAGASRLLLGMGRDGALSRRLFGQLDEESGTPVRAIWFLGAATLTGSLLAGFQLIVELLNFGAFAGFILVNCAVINHFYLKGGGSRNWWRDLAAPLAGAAVCAYLWLSLSSSAKAAGGAWLAAGAIYLAVLTRGFRLAPKRLEVG